MIEPMVEKQTGGTNDPMFVESITKFCSETVAKADWT